MVQALSHDAQLAKANPFLSRPITQQFPDYGPQLLRHRANKFFHQGIQGGGGFNHFLGHQLAEPSRNSFIKEAKHKEMDKGLQPFRCGPGFTLDAEQGIFLPGTRLRVFHDRGIQAFLIAEVVVNGREIGFGALADCPDSGVAEALLGKWRGRGGSWDRG